MSAVSHVFDNELAAGEMYHRNLLLVRGDGGGRLFDFTGTVPDLVEVLEVRDLARAGEKAWTVTLGEGVIPVRWNEDSFHRWLGPTWESTLARLEVGGGGVHRPIAMVTFQAYVREKFLGTKDLETIRLMDGQALPPGRNLVAELAEAEVEVAEARAEYASVQKDIGVLTKIERLREEAADLRDRARGARDMLQDRSSLAAEVQDRLLDGDEG